MQVADLLRQYLTADVRQGMAQAVCEDTARIRTAVDAAAATLLAGIAEVSGSPDGARLIFARLHEQDDLVSLASLAEVTRGSQANMLMERGTDQLLILVGGDFFEAAGRAVSSYAGLGLGVCKSILCLLTPIVLSMVWRAAQDAGVADPASLSQMLGMQARSIVGIAPEGFCAVAGREPRLVSVGQYLKSQAAQQQPMDEAQEQWTWSSFLSRFIPGALIALIAITLLWQFFGAPGQPPSSTPEPVLAQPDRQDMAQLVGARMSPQGMVASPESGTVSPTIAVHEQLSQTLQRLARTLDEVRSPAGAAAALPQLREAIQQVRMAQAASVPGEALGQQSTARICAARLPGLRDAVVKATAAAANDAEFSAASEQLLRELRLAAASQTVAGATPEPVGR